MEKNLLEKANSYELVVCLILAVFSRGAEFEDKYGLLQGVGKVSKHVKIKDVKSINEAVLQYYIGQAVALDS